MTDETAERNDDILLLDEVDAGLELPLWEPTGEPRVDEALELLSTLDTEDVSGHAEVYGRIHHQLRAALTDADSPAF
jgi:hypothetical protein